MERAATVVRQTKETNIELTLGLDGGEVVVDTGVGFGALSPDRAVDPFVTTKDPGKGMGLGLSISLNILTGMGGGLALARRVNGPGARATITLPRGEKLP
mgnify:CR=1 FL=1